jgi:hypothetical protein
VLELVAVAPYEAALTVKEVQAPAVSLNHVEPDSLPSPDCSAESGVAVPKRAGRVRAVMGGDQNICLCAGRLSWAALSALQSSTCTSKKTPKAGAAT